MYIFKYKVVHFSKKTHAKILIISSISNPDAAFLFFSKIYVSQHLEVKRGKEKITGCDIRNSLSSSLDRHHTRDICCNAGVSTAWSTITVLRQSWSTEGPAAEARPTTARHPPRYLVLWHLEPKRKVFVFR